MKTFLCKEKCTVSRVIFCCLVLFVGFTPSIFLKAESGNAEVNLFVVGCNNNLVCEIGGGENVFNCPIDCSNSESVSGVSTNHPASADIFSLGEVISSPVSGTSTPLTSGEVKVKPDIKSAVINWKTSLPAIATLEWGKGSEKEGGVISEFIYSTDHIFKIEGLEAGKRYYFSLKARDKFNRSVSVMSQEFITLVPVPSPSKPLPPSNISKLSMSVSDTSIRLSWQSGKDVSLVRVTRSKRSYSKDPFEGKIIYEGTGSVAIDNDILSDETYYYSIFTKGGNGLYSSGAIIKSDAAGRENVLHSSGSVSKGDTVSDESVLSAIDTLPLILITDPGYSEKNIVLLRKMSITDLIITQDRRPVSFSAQKIPIDGDKNFTVSISAEKIPDSAKDVILILQGTQKSGIHASYLMALNTDTSLFEAVIPGVPSAGRYNLQVLILDYSNQVFGNINGYITATKIDKKAEFNNKIMKIRNTVTRPVFIVLDSFMFVLDAMLKIFKTVGNSL